MPLKCLMLIALLYFFCGQKVAATPALESSAEKRARSVTIYRDAYDVPHIYGRSDTDVVFGAAYAQGEDNFQRVEEYYIRSIGRAAEVFGEKELKADVLNHELEAVKLSQEEYKNLDQRTRSLCDAYAAGLNYFLSQHPQTKPRLITHFEGWHVLAFYRWLWFISDVPFLTGLKDEELGIARIVNPEHKLPFGSNGWAVAPAKSADGRAMLFLSPHDYYFSEWTAYEMHLHSDEGWNLSGEFPIGGMLADLGFNENLGWTVTTNYPDVGDVYAETFDDAKRPLAYRYGDGYRMATEWKETIKIKTSLGVQEKTFTFRKTHHGGIVAERDGKPLAIKLAKYEIGGSGYIKQYYAMSKARSLSEFKTAVAQQGHSYHNMVYADRAGNILYLYSGAVPRRSPKFDWDNPVDGSLPETEWQGYHTLAEMPQILNPKSGFVQSCNSSPFTTLDEGNLKPENYPKYMVREGDNERARRSRKILSSQAKFSFDDLTRLAFDTRVGEAANELPLLFADWERLQRTDVQRAALRPVIEELKAWNQISTIDSVAMTVFAGYHRNLYSKYQWRENAFFFPQDSQPVKDGARIKALEEIIAALEKDWGTWRVKWGDRTRLQRPATNDLSFKDSEPSLPVAGAPGYLGVVFNFYTVVTPGQQKRYGNIGSGYVAVVEFGEKVRARSVVVFGESAEPHSKHFFDQAPLFARGEFKPAWFTLEEIKSHLERAYHPGEEAR